MLEKCEEPFPVLRMMKLRFIMRILRNFTTFAGLFKLVLLPIPLSDLWEIAIKSRTTFLIYISAITSTWYPLSFAL